MLFYTQQKITIPVQVSNATR